MLKKLNFNPDSLLVGDCVVRAIACALNQSWEQTYSDLCMMGLQMSDMPSANRVWGNYLRIKGFRRRELPNDCPDCYTVKEFCDSHRKGTYIVATGTHVIAIRDSDYIDTWDSGNEIITYYWENVQLQSI